MLGGARWSRVRTAASEITAAQAAIFNALGVAEPKRFLGVTGRRRLAKPGRTIASSEKMLALITRVAPRGVAFATEADFGGAHGRSLAEISHNSEKTAKTMSESHD